MSIGLNDGRGDMLPPSCSRVAAENAPRDRFIPGSVQLIRPVRVLSLAVAHSAARPNRQRNPPN